MKTYTTQMAKQATRNQMKAKFTTLDNAEEIAISATPGTYRRAAGTNFCGLKRTDGTTWVLGHSKADIQNPDATIMGKPARQVYDGFTVMHALNVTES